MNKIKGVLVLALVFVISASCFGSEVTIVRKKNKWISSAVQTEQTMPEPQTTGVN